MEKIIWSEKFSVGHSKFDQQHQAIIDLINQLIELQKAPFDKEAVRSINSDLVKYGMEHLKDEELLLQENDYPEFLKHKHEHLLYVKKTTKYLKNTIDLDEETLSQIIGFLADWWTHHILEEDMKYKPFFENKGIN